MNVSTLLTSLGNLSRLSSSFDTNVKFSLDLLHQVEIFPSFDIMHLFYNLSVFSKNVRFVNSKGLPGSLESVTLSEIFGQTYAFRIFKIMK